MYAFAKITVLIGSRSFRTGGGALNIFEHTGMLPKIDPLFGLHQLQKGLEIYQS